MEIVNRYNSRYNYVVLKNGLGLNLAYQKGPAQPDADGRLHEDIGLEFVRFLVKTRLAY